MANEEYQRWETRFDAPDYVFGTTPNTFLAKQKALLPTAGRALAVADGEGRNGVWLAQQGLDVVSMDFSPSAQRKALALAKQRGVTITTELADLTKYNWPRDTYDVIAVIFTQITTPPERAVMFAGIRQALKTGGLLLLEGYTPKQLQYGTGGPKAVENLYTRALLEAEFAIFAEKTIAEYDVEIDEGPAHRGMSAVIDLIGRK